MIRIEIIRRLDCRQGRGRNKVNPNFVSYEPTEAEAIARIRELHIAGERIAPGYMPILAAKLYDDAAFKAWVRNGGEMPAPFRVLTAEEIEALAKRRSRKQREG